ncbi:MotA/TolQ/ExbB proton channel family protein [Sulfitobacter sp. F26204]|uniref:MotA/TolQ/ExbB proton channel family protein n=1 Tax=Sulfitobacter sp. F26204 TaxID=2996014 RepID=UPI00225E5180|nr:MotA/TolQ/ExbB proton channel family protein [Sulfitobacter sp. F26204]MCX7559539.1 MotA/TolQ/ExbB proton channel family protein [Sulfitobacter sp. F26204]
MNFLQALQDLIAEVFNLGGPVVVLLIAVSILTTGVVFYKIWQFRQAGVGRHTALQAAIESWDQGDQPKSFRLLNDSTSYLAAVIRMAMEHHVVPDIGQRLEAEAEARFAVLERGFRLLDSVAQLAPLLGLFGTVLGMIEAFQSLQAAGSQVDPSLLAGGIWVALLTTAVGLGVAMPTSVILSWLESRMASERVLAERALAAILTPTGEMGPEQRSQQNAAPSSRPVLHGA